MKIATAHKPNPRQRTTSDSVWPLRRANGLTWAEDKERRDAREEA